MKNDKEKFDDFIKFLEKLGVTLYPWQKESIKLAIASKNYNTCICMPKNVGRKEAIAIMEYIDKEMVGRDEKYDRISES